MIYKTESGTQHEHNTDRVKMRRFTEKRYRVIHFCFHFSHLKKQKKFRKQRQQYVPLKNILPSDECSRRGEFDPERDGVRPAL